MTKKNDSNRTFWLVVGIMALAVIVAVVVSCCTNSNDTVYVVSVGENPVELSLPANWTAHLWVENGELWMAITDGTHISNEWKIEEGQNMEGSASGGWKEAWRVQITEVIHSNNGYLIQFTFHDTHYA